MPFAYARNVHFCITVYVFLIFLVLCEPQPEFSETHQRCRADWRLHTSSHAEILRPMAVLVLLVMLNDVKVGCRVVLLATKVSYI